MCVCVYTSFYQLHNIQSKQWKGCVGQLSIFRHSKLRLLLTLTNALADSSRCNHLILCIFLNHATAELIKMTVACQHNCLDRTTDSYKKNASWTRSIES